MNRPRLFLIFILSSAAASLRAAGPPHAAFLEKHCYECHDGDTKKGGLDLTALKTDFGDRAAFDTWVKIEDVIAKDEMPPPKVKKRPAQSEAMAVTAWLDAELAAAAAKQVNTEGRAVIRRLTRVEYENAMRDLLAMPDLRLVEMLPADATRGGYDKIGEALDLSHVQLSRYLDAADYALDMAIATRPTAPAVLKRRIYPTSNSNMLKAVGNGSAVLLKNFEPDPLWPAPGKLTGKDYRDSYDLAEQAGVGQSKSAAGFFHPNVVYLRTDYGFIPIFPGKYRIRISLWSCLWNAGKVEPSPKTEVGLLYRMGHTLGYFDAPSLSPLVSEITPWLDRGDEVFFDPASLMIFEGVQVRQRPGGAAEYVGPAVATDWMEVEDPLYDQWPPESHRRLFGELPIKPFDPATGAIPPKRAPVVTVGHARWPSLSDIPPEDANPPLCTVASADPKTDATRLLADFLPRAFRRAVTDAEVQRYVGLALARMEVKDCFEDAMRYAYKTALATPSFLFRVEKPGKLDDFALASRLSFWLWNSVPDAALLRDALEGKLHQPAVLGAQVDRMLGDPRSERFVNDFLDQWLKLRDIDSTDPDAKLYPEFHVYLKDSMIGESRAFLRELIDKNLSVTNVVASDFLMINERLAEHYRFVGPVGCKIQRVAIPPDCERGGFLTQASVMKVTANGTVTSPVKRGVWFTESILGRPAPPPPPAVPAIDPDTHGATTIREQLARHRADPACAACHAKIDPPGFALESFDVIGGVRSRYRSLGVGDPTSRVFPGGNKPVYLLGPAVDTSGQLTDGRGFKDVAELRKHLLSDPGQIATNLVQQLLVYATGAPITYRDRKGVAQIVAASKQANYGVRNLIHLVAQSELFQSK